MLRHSHYDPPKLGLNPAPIDVVVAFFFIALFGAVVYMLTLFGHS